MVAGIIMCRNWAKMEVTLPVPVHNETRLKQRSGEFILRGFSASLWDYGPRLHQQSYSALPRSAPTMNPQYSALRVHWEVLLVHTQM